MKRCALYIHIPFCKQKCLYCDFQSFANLDSMMESYIDALEKEINKKSINYEFVSLFIGGGTPSYLSSNLLEKLMNIISKLKFVENAEKTIECNPGTVNKEKLLILKKGGINRLSFGLQTCDDKLLKKIGRIHDYKTFKENYYLAREVGFNNINIDVMFGLPTQTLEGYLEGLHKIIDLNPDHLSVYSLIVEENTPFYRMYDEGKLELPDENIERLMYEKGKVLLENEGYKQYEISNFSKDSKQCFHNKEYWKCNEYLGVGVSSSSYINKIRYKNIDGVKNYIESINNNKEVTIVENVNTINDEIEEFMFMGLRMIDGIDENEFEKRFNKSVDQVYKSVILDNINKGLLIRKDNRIYLSEKGVELSNVVMSDMILT